MREKEGSERERPDHTQRERDRGKYEAEREKKRDPGRERGK